MSDAYIGSIVMFGGNFAPRSWALCNGQLLSIAQNTALFSILGTTFGGNGTSTFGLPDLRGRAPVSAGQGPGLSNYVLGEITGVENVTLLQNQMPMHTHAVNADGGNAGTGSPVGAYLSKSAASIYNTASPTVQMGPNMIGPTGGNLPFSVIQPVLAVNFIICINGIFPSRN